jgi:hypothetical protein
MMGIPRESDLVPEIQVERPDMASPALFTGRSTAMGQDL